MDATSRRAARILIMVPAAALMLLGLNSGLLLMGVAMPIVNAPDLHSTLLVFGFVGTLISLERAVALRAAWAYSAPVLLAAGSVLTLTGVPVIAGKAVITAGLVMHALQYRAIWLRQPMTATAVQAAGAVTGIAAALAWCGGVPPNRLVPLLAVFLILTIAGERLELARLASPGVRAERLLLILAVGLAVTVLLTLTMPVVAVPVAGILMLLMVAWLLRYDIVRGTIRQPGLPRFVAVCVYLGYGWLLVAGAGWLLGGARTEGVIYDATTHAIFLGFVITMIMAHAPLILPAVLQVNIPYHRALYVPVALLQVALLVRVVAGDAWGLPGALQAGGIGAVAAILLFAATAVTVSLRERGRKSRVPA